MQENFDKLISIESYLSNQELPSATSGETLGLGLEIPANDPDTLSMGEQFGKILAIVEQGEMTRV